MQLYQHIAFTYISKLLRCVVYRKAKELKVLYGKPYILKISIKNKVKILYERLIKRRLMNKTVLTVQSFNDYYNAFGESEMNPYLHPESEISCIVGRNRLYSTHTQYNTEDFRRPECLVSSPP